MKNITLGILIGLAGLIILGPIAPLLIIIYLTPSIVAVNRNHSNQSAIIGLNILLGWTFLGWVASFVWSLTDNVKVKI